MGYPWTTGQVLTAADLDAEFAALQNQINNLATNGGGGSNYNPAAVVITNGSVNGTSLGLTTPAAAQVTTLTLTGALTGTSAILSGALTVAGTVGGAGIVSLLSPYLASATASSTYAPLASPVLTGVPVAPTAATATNTTQIATTAFVKAQSYVTAAGASTAAPVQSVASRTGSVTLTHSDLTDWAAATSTFGGVSSVASRTGAITLTHSDLTDWAAATSSFLTSVPVTSVFGRTGTVTLLSSDVTGALGFTPQTAAQVTSAVQAAASVTTPIMDSTAAVGTATTWARADHVHASDTTRAPIASPTFSGTVTIPAGASISGYALTSAIPAASSTTPVVDGTAAVGVATTYARADHAHPTDTSRAPTASPVLTGTPTAPTAAVGTSSTQIATTAYVIGQASAATPTTDGVAAVGTSTSYARGDHIHPTDTSRAPIASPSFAGTVTVPTLSSTGQATFASANFGSVLDSGNDSVANHIALWSTSYGFGVTSNRLNYVAPSGAGHYLRVNGADQLSVTASGVTANGAITAPQFRETGYTVLSAKWYGAVGDGTTDNTTALNNALAALSGTGGKIVFPPGKYKFLSNVSFTYPAGRFSVTIEGSGQDSTILYWPNVSGGLTFGTSSQYHSIHVRDLSLTTGVTNGGTGILVTNTFCGGAYEQSDFTGVTIRGDDNGGGTDYWTNGISIVGQSNINYTSCLFYGGGSGSSAHGIGVICSGNTAETGNPGFFFSVVHNFFGCGFYNHSVGFQYGTYLQGIAFNNTNFTNGATGVYAPSGIAQPAQLTLTGCQLNCALNSIYVPANFPAIQIVGCLIYVASGGSGIALTGGTSQTCINSNAFSSLGGAASGNGITINANAQAIITGNSFYDLSNGIFLGASATGVTVLGNTYSGNTANVGNLGTGNSIGVAVP